MNKWEQLDTATLANGDVMTLHRRGDEYSLRVANFDLMNSRQHGSEERLAELAVAKAGDLAGAAVLVGGLGMGFTLRAALDLLPADARVTVAELVPQVVEWNRTYLSDLAAAPLADPRVSVSVGDVATPLRAANARFDIVLLDTDNGPEGTTQDGNEWLYGPAGLGTIRASLKPGGVLAVWSVFPSDPFTKRLMKAGFDVEVRNVRSRGKKGNRHVIWVARNLTARRRNS
ncbi:MAG TPA: hypothetical protein VFD39_04420 [Trueperaceae bacterium]|nr:hypothetical protein [Trueperaceae bacterium]